MAAFVLTLRLGVSAGAGDAQAAAVGEEAFGGGDVSAPGLAEGEAVVAEQLLLDPVLGERGLERVDGVGAVLGIGETHRADVKPGGVVQQLADDDLRAHLTGSLRVGEAVCERVELPHLHYRCTGEPRPSRPRALARVGIRDAGGRQDPRDGRHRRDRRHEFVGVDPGEPDRFGSVVPDLFLQPRTDPQDDLGRLLVVDSHRVVRRRGARFSAVLPSWRKRRRMLKNDGRLMSSRWQNSQNAEAIGGKWVELDDLAADRRSERSRNSVLRHGVNTVVRQVVNKDLRQGIPTRRTTVTTKRYSPAGSRLFAAWSEVGEHAHRGLDAARDVGEEAGGGASVADSVVEDQ